MPSAFFGSAQLAASEIKREKERMERRERALKRD
jgi:hypothetical protein